MKTERIIVASLPSLSYLPWLFFLIAPIYVIVCVTFEGLPVLLFLFGFAPITYYFVRGVTEDDEKDKINRLAKLHEFSPNTYKYFVDVKSKLGIADLEWEYFVDSKLSSPRVYGMGKHGSIVLPEDLIKKIDENNGEDNIKINEALILHEIGHLFRQDHPKIAILESVEKILSFTIFISIYVFRWSIVIFVPFLVAAFIFYNDLIAINDTTDEYFLLVLVYLVQVIGLITLNRMSFLKTERNYNYATREYQQIPSSFSNRSLLIIAIVVFLLDISSVASYPAALIILGFSLVIILTASPTRFLLRLFRFALMRQMELYADSLTVDFQGTSKYLELALLKFSVSKYRNTFGLGLSSKPDLLTKNSQARPLLDLIHNLVKPFTQTHPSIKERIKAANSPWDLLQNNNVEVFVGSILPIPFIADKLIKVFTETPINSVLFSVFVSYMCLSMYSTSLLLIYKNTMISILVFYFKKFFYILIGVTLSIVIFSISNSLVFFLTSLDSIDFSMSSFLVFFLIGFDFMLIFLQSILLVLPLLIINTLLIREIMTCYKISLNRIHPTLNLIYYSLYTFFSTFFIFSIFLAFFQGELELWQMFFGITGVVISVRSPQKIRNLILINTQIISDEISEGEKSSRSIQDKSVKFLALFMSGFRFLIMLALIWFVSLIFFQDSTSFWITVYYTIGISVCIRITLQLFDVLKKNKKICPSCNRVVNGYYTLGKKCESCQQVLNEQFVVVSKNILVSETRVNYDLIISKLYGS